LRSDSHVANKPNNTKVWVWICGPSSQGMCRWQGERTRQRKDDIWQCIIVAGHISNNHPEQKCLKIRWFIPMLMNTTNNHQQPPSICLSENSSSKSSTFREIPIKFIDPHIIPLQSQS
jgi:hypothetical protein